MSEEEVKNARMSEEELDTLLMDMEKIIELFADGTGGNQPPQFQSPPLLRPVWTRVENEQFEIVIAQCFMEAIENRWEAVAARLPGKTPAQVREKLLNDISLIQNSYLVNIHDTSIINGTTPPPTYWTYHQHYMSDGGSGGRSEQGSANGDYVIVISHGSNNKGTKPTCQKQHNLTQTFAYGY